MRFFLRQNIHLWAKSIMTTRMFEHLKPFLKRIMEMKEMFSVQPTKRTGTFEVEVTCLDSKIRIK